MNIPSYDYIIIGGGTAGCILANRLTANPKVSVLVLEAGHEGKGFIYDMPAGSFMLMGNPKADWIYPTEPDPSANNRSNVWAAGKVLGGSSGINGMVYIRGQRGDYDLWRASGCPGWGFDDVYPYFLKAERFAGPPSEQHGTQGLQSVSPPRVLHPLTGPFLQACAQTGMPTRSEYCGGELDGAFTVFGTTRRGKRASTRKAYLEPVLGRSNLTVLNHCHAEKILLEGRRATGVQVLCGDERRTFSARAEVLLCAGSLASPTLLMRSGIGPGADLAAQGIAVAVDLPGVGRNVQEHCGVTQSRLVNVPTYNTQMRPWQMAGHLLRYLLARRGMLTSIAVHAMAYAKSDAGQPEPDMCMSFLPLCIGFVDGHPALHKQAGITIGSQLTRPRSRGRIRLRDASPLAKPIIEHALIADPHDVELTVEGCKLVAAVFAAPALAPYVIANNEPAEIPRTDAEWEAYARARVGIGYHPVGSCRMGSDEHAVVDPLLRVRGVAGLRVVDASVMPNIISGNTNAPTIMIAEKAADIIMPGADRPLFGTAAAHAARPPDAVAPR